MAVKITVEWSGESWDETQGLAIAAWIRNGMPAGLASPMPTIEVKQAC
jgi:hypothetical protein